MRYEVLGPLRVVSDGEVVTPRSRRALDVLAVLLLRRGQVVDPQRILELVWGHEALGLTPAVVHTVVARLRRSLGSAAVETTAAGYRLGPATLDADDFVRAVERPGRESPHETAERLSAALSLWRGPVAYSDLEAGLLTAERTFTSRSCGAWLAATSSTPC